MKTLRNRVELRWGVVALLLGFLMASGANAQTGFKGAFELQQTVRWGQAVLPPGRYDISIASNSMPVQALVRSSDGKRTVIEIAGSYGDIRSRRSALYLMKSGNEVVVQALNLPQLRRSFVYANPAKRRPEEPVSDESRIVLLLKADQ